MSNFIEYGVIENPFGDNKILYARIDEDGLIRMTCTEDNPEYLAWLNPVEHLTEIIPADEA